MENILVKHIMDKEYRKVTLDNAFIEALGLSNGCANEIEEQQNSLLEYLKKYPDFIQNITDEYKVTVLKGWEYEVIKAAENTYEKEINIKCLEEWGINNYGRVESIGLGETFAVIKAEKGNISLVETSDGDAITMSVQQEDIRESYEEKIRNITFEEEVYISNVDVCTSEATIYFTNKTQVNVELERDEDDVNSCDYDSIVLSRKVTFK